MRILVLTRSTPEHPQKGGMEAHAAQVIEGLAARGHEVDAVTTAHPAGHETLACGRATVHYLRGTPPGVYSAPWWRESLRFVLAAHARAPYDVLLAESGAAEAVLEHRNGLRLPLVAVMHGATRWTLEGLWRNLFGTASPLQLASMALTFAREWVTVRRRSVRYDRLVCVSAPLVDACVQDLLYPRDRVVCVPNGVDVDGIRAAAPRREEVRAQLGLARDRVMVLVSGRVEPDKGVWLAMMTAAQLAGEGVPLDLVVAGDGSQRRALEAVAARTGGARFVGHVPFARLAELHAASDVYLFPTLLSESFGYGVAEAMAAGKPAVAPMVGGIPMMLEPEVTGLAIAPGDGPSMRAALVRLARDDALRRRLGEEAQRRAVRFTTARMLDGIEAVLGDVAGR